MKTSFWEELGYVKVILNTQMSSDLQFYWTLKLLHIILYTDTEATALQSRSPVRSGFVMQRFSSRYVNITVNDGYPHSLWFTLHQKLVAGCKVEMFMLICRKLQFVTL